MYNTNTVQEVTTENNNSNSDCSEFKCSPKIKGLRGDVIWTAGSSQEGCDESFQVFSFISRRSWNLTWQKLLQKKMQLQRRVSLFSL